MMWERMCSFRITWSLEKRKKKKKIDRGKRPFWKLGNVNIIQVIFRPIKRLNLSEAGADRLLSEVGFWKGPQTFILHC